MLRHHIQAQARDTVGSFKKFCGRTSIHGLKYVVIQDIHWVQRVAWMFVFLAGVVFSGWFCGLMWQKWTDSPVLMSLETTRYPHKNIPFPAVTICNVNKVSKRRLEYMLSVDRRFDRVSYEEMQRTLRYLTKLDRAIDREEDLAKLSSMFHDLDVTPRDLFELLNKTAPTCRDMVVDCIWQGNRKPCYDYLSFLPSDDGLCCVFNGANYSDPDLGILNNAPDPLIASGNGYRKGLSVVLDADIEDYCVTNGNFDGFKILIHASQKFPDVADRGFAISPGYEIFAGVKGSSSDTSSDVAVKVLPDKRNCRAEGERGSLAYFPRYSQSGCIIECATEKIQKVHQCRPYFLRSGIGTPLCGMELYANVSTIYENVRSDPDGEGCDCPPPCTDEWFEPEISYGTFPGHGFNVSRTFQRLAGKLNLSGLDIHENAYFKKNMALLHVYYKERTGVRYKTDIRFGVEDFISAMGGLLSLGVGLSFVSVLELIYVFIINLVRCFRRPHPTSSELNCQDTGSAKAQHPAATTINQSTDQLFNL